MTHPDKTQGEVLLDKEPQGLTPEEAGNMVILAQEELATALVILHEDRHARNVARDSDRVNEIKKFWHSEVEEAITAAAKHGERSCYLINLRYSKAKELAAYGKRLGWQATASIVGAIHIEWPEEIPISDSTDKKSWWRFW